MVVDDGYTWTAYVHTNKINGKTYVGITRCSVEDRWKNGRGYSTQPFYRAIQKYGWDNFTHEIVASGLTRDEAESLEIELIEKLDSTMDGHGYNVSRGSFGTLGVSAIPVYQFDLHGNFIKEYSSVIEAERETGSRNIIACCKGKFTHANKYIWRYKKDVPDVNKLKDEIDISIYDVYEPIYQFDLDGNFIAEYESANHAKLSNENWNTGVTLGCCRGKFKQGYGYLWRFKRDIPDIDAMKNIDIDFSRKRMEREHILQFDLNGNFIQEYISCIMAAESVDGTADSIGKACKGKIKTSAGYMWMYKKDYNGTPPVFKPRPTEHVFQYDLDGNFIAEYESSMQAAELFGLHYRSINNACRGIQKTCGGYIWKRSKEEYCKEAM